jgi:hypothetical protein
MDVTIKREYLYLYLHRLRLNQLWQSTVLEELTPCVNDTQLISLSSFYRASCSMHVADIASQHNCLCKRIVDLRVPYFSSFSLRICLRLFLSLPSPHVPYSYTSNFALQQLNLHSLRKRWHHLDSHFMFRFIQNYNFASGSVWVWNLVPDIKGGTQTEDVWEQGVEENIWTEERWSDMRLEKTT